jgi:hypothetical protein
MTYRSTHLHLAAFISCLLLVAVWGWTSEAAADDINRFIQDATSASPRVRQQALEALGNSGDPRALQPLLVALHDDSPTIRQYAVAALRALSRTLKGVYHIMARWIDNLIISLGGDPAPNPPVAEKTGKMLYL